MSNSNSNWRSSAAAMNSTTDRRVNLAMTAELALGSTSSSIPTGPSMNYNSMNIGGGSIVPRQRGGVAASDSNDILGSFMNKPTGPTQSSNKGFNNMMDDQFGKGTATNRLYNNNTNNNQFTSQGNSDLTGNGFSTNNLTQNNNINNLYKQNNTDTLSYFNSQMPSHRADPDSSQGFKVQRVRGVGGATNPTSNGISSNIMALNGSSSVTNGFGLNGNTSLKDENIDSQTRQVKREIDSLDAKLNMKSHQQPPSLPQQQTTSASTNGFGSNLAPGGSYRNFYQSNQETASSTAAGFNGLNSKGFGQSELNNPMSKQQPLQQKKGDDDSLATAMAASGPFKKMQSNPVLAPSNGIKSQATETLNATKEFQTGTYDPSNILGGTRQGRMRSLGKGGKESSKNQHEEKAAQATGNKQLPDEVAVVEQFECPEGCGRSFNKKALEKHIPLCKKVFVPKKPEKESSAPTNKVESKKDVVGQSKQEQQKLPPKGSKKPAPGGKGGAAESSVQAAKNEALRKLKEQKKKELAAGTNAEDNGDVFVKDPIQKGKAHNDEDDKNVIDDEGYF